MIKRDYITIVLILIIGVIGQTLIKFGSVSLGEIKLNNISDFFRFLLNVIRNPLIIIGVLFYGVTAVLWIIILNKIELSVAAPLMSLNYVLTLIVGALIFNEAVTLFKILGVVTIIIGVYLLTRK